MTSHRWGQRSGLELVEVQSHCVSKECQDPAPLPWISCLSYLTVTASFQNFPLSPFLPVTRLSVSLTEQFQFYIRLQSENNNNTGAISLLKFKLLKSNGFALGIKKKIFF